MNLKIIDSGLHGSPGRQQRFPGTFNTENYTQYMIQLLHGLNLFHHRKRSRIIPLTSINCCLCPMPKDRWSVHWIKITSISEKPI